MHHKQSLRAVAALVCSVIAGFPQDAPSVRTYAFRTLSGFYLTAENGGGANINTDRKELGPWEKFVLVPVSPGVFALKTDNGSYLGEIAPGAERRNRATNPDKGGLSARQADQGAATGLKLVIVNPDGPVVALMTPSGKYVTAEEGGGVKARGARAISTDRTAIGDWEQFLLIDASKMAQ